MSEAEHPDRRRREVTVEDVRQLLGASTPHFALQIRNRLARLVDGLDEGHPARQLAEQEIGRLNRLGLLGETRGHEAEEGLEPLPSVSPESPAAPDEPAPEPHTTPR